MPLGPDLEQVDGMVEVQWDGSSRQMASLRGMLHDASSRLHGVVQADVKLPAWGKAIEDILISISGKVDANSTEIKMDLSPASYLKAFLDPREFPLPERLQVLDLTQREPLHIQLNDVVRSRVSLDREDPQWSIDGPMRIRYGQEHSPIGVDVVFTTASGRLRDPLSTETDAQFSLWGSWPVIEYQPVQTQDLGWRLKGRMGVQGQRIHVILDEGSSVETGAIRLDQGKADRVALRISQAISLAYDWSSQQWQAGPGNAQLVLPKIRWRGQTVSISKAGVRLQEARGEGEAWRAKGMVKFLGVNTAMESFHPPLTNLAIGFDADPEEFRAGIVAEAADKTVRVKGRLTHHLQTRSGRLHATLTPQVFSPSSLTLSRLIQPWTYSFDITSGQLGISIACVWEPVTPGEYPGMGITRGDVTVALKGIGGYYEDVLVDDVNTTINIMANDVRNFATLSPAEVSVGRIQAGIEMTHATFEISLQLGGNDSWPTIDLENFSANAFGGRISSPRIYVDLARLPTLFTLKLDGIQLDQLLQLEQQQGLEGTGILDGIIPITLQAAGVEVKGGKLAARPPGGVIRFQPPEGTAQTFMKANPQMEIVLQSLRNFHYDVLSAEIDYQEDGTLNLATRLEGKNPDLKQGRPVHFNVTIEENIPALLKSVRVMKGIEDNIEQLFQGPLF